MIAAQEQNSGKALEQPSDPDVRLLSVHPSMMARRLFWHLFSIGSKQIFTDDGHEPYEKPGVHIFWVQSGQGELHYEGNRYRLEPGPIVWLVDMRRPRVYSPVNSSSLTTTGFRFGGPGSENWYEALHGREYSEIAVDDFDFIQETQMELRRLVQAQPTGAEWQIHLLINDVLGKVLSARHPTAAPDFEVPPPVVRVLNAIAADPRRDWKAKGLAGIAQISYSALRTLFSESGYGTIHEYIQGVRLEQARLLMADKRLTVKDVAGKLNFSSEFYFSHFFRRHTGVSPTVFRNTLEKRITS